MYVPYPLTIEKISNYPVRPDIKAFGQIECDVLNAAIHYLF